jgi:hypothetical protein
MALNLVLALCWLVLALASVFYFLLQPAAGRVALFGNDIPVTWVAGISLFMFCYNMLRWWLVRVQKRQREAMKESSGQDALRKDAPSKAQHWPKERNPDFDFSDEGQPEPGPSGHD